MQLFCGILVLIAVPAVAISYLAMLFEDVKKIIKKDKKPLTNQSGCDTIQSERKRKGDNHNEESESLEVYSY